VVQFTKVADASELSPGTMKKFAVGGEQVLVANVGGKFFAIRSVCTHMQGDLSLGTLEGNIVTCPRHGSQFDLTTGKSVRGPKVAFVRLSTKDEPAYEVKLEGSSIMIGMP